LLVQIFIYTDAEVSVVPPISAERSLLQRTFFLQGVDCSRIATLKCTLLHTQPWSALHIPLGIGHTQHQTGNFGCIFPAALWTRDQHAPPDSVQFDYTVCWWSPLWPSTSISWTFTCTAWPFWPPSLSLLSEFPVLTQACQFLSGLVALYLSIFAAQEEFQHMLEFGTICSSFSNRSSPLHMVPKRTPGDCRQCGDFRALNKVTVQDR